jgi:hypothetical protein
MRVFKRKGGRKRRTIVIAMKRDRRIPEPREKTKRVEDRAEAGVEREYRMRGCGNENIKDHANQMRGLNLQISDALDAYSAFLIFTWIPNNSSTTRQSPSPPSFLTGPTETSCYNSNGFARLGIMGTFSEVESSRY